MVSRQGRRRCVVGVQARAGCVPAVETFRVSELLVPLVSLLHTCDEERANQHAGHEVGGVPEQGHEGVGRRDPRNIIISVPSASSHVDDLLPLVVAAPPVARGSRHGPEVPLAAARRLGGGPTCNAPAVLADYSQNLRGCRRHARATASPRWALTRRRAAAWIA